MRHIARIGLCVVAAISAFGVAAEGTDSGDTAWILSATALVLMMTLPGLSMFYAGMVRSANVLSILMQCFVIACLITIIWVIIGYSLAFGSSVGGLIGGVDHLLFNGVTEDAVNGSIPTSLFAMFQLTFAVITPALIVGGFAERMRFKSILVFTAAWSLLVYMPLCHWVWGGGWLGAGPFGLPGVMDFAGGIVVHISAGTAAIVAALYIGNRQAYPGPTLIPHNVPLCVIGAGLLWVGWFGFNGGSALAADGNAAMALTATHISAATGAFTWMVVEWIRYGKPTVLGALTGMVAGLGTITPASGFVGPAGALVIGFLAGIVCFIATSWIKRTLKIDDSLDVFSVHGVGGILGTLLTAVFASSAIGVFSGQEEILIVDQFLSQTVGVVATLIWTAGITWLILVAIDKLIGLRVSESEETEGLDLLEHNERGYSF